MIYLPSTINARINDDYIKNKILAIRSNTCGYIDDNLKFHALIYPLYIYGYIIPLDYKLDFFNLNEKIQSIVKGQSVIDTEHVLKKLIGKIDSRVIKIANKWSHYSQI